MSIAASRSALPFASVRKVEKYLVPLLHATEIRLAQHEGQFTDYVELAANSICLAATRMAFELLGAFPPEDPVLSAKTTVDVIIADMPRPDYDVEPIDIEPTVRPPQRQVVAATQEPPKKDPRPKD
jgi:hypothetical protein